MGGTDAETLLEKARLAERRGDKLDLVLKPSHYHRAAIFYTEAGEEEKASECAKKAKDAIVEYSKIVGFDYNFIFEQYPGMKEFLNYKKEESAG